MFLKGIDHVQIAAPQNSENLCREFFSGIFEMKEIPKPENLRKRGGSLVSMRRTGASCRNSRKFYSGSKSPSGIQCCRSKKAERKVNGIEIKEDEPLEGAERFYINDPFGNRLEFLERREKNKSCHTLYDSFYDGTLFFLFIIIMNRIHGPFRNHFIVFNILRGRVSCFFDRE